MPERIRIERMLAVCWFGVLVCTNAYGQTGAVAAPPNGSTPVGTITSSAGFRISGDLSGARVPTGLRGWRSREASSRRWSESDAQRPTVSNGRSRKKALLIGAAIGGAAGAGGGAYAVYATGGDADPWVVPAFAGIGAAAGAACGFLISLF